MRVFRILCSYRLLATVITLYLKLKSEVYAHQTHDGADPRSDHIGDSPEKDGIEASIFVHPDVSAVHPASGGNRDAEVELLVRSAAARDGNPHAEGLIRASSILMEYDEDTRKYLLREGTGNHRHHRIRHKSRKHVPSSTLSDDYFAANDAPLAESDSLEEQQSVVSTAKPKMRSRSPLRALDYNHHPNRRKVFSSSLKNRGNGTWIALHSPVRIYIPVRYHDEKSTLLSTDKCIQCAGNITLIAPRGKSDVEVPPPAISICPRLAQERGRINVAVTVGPRPGVLVTEGHYPVELIIWKPGGHIHSCHYSIDVVVKRCKEVLAPEKGSANCSEGTLWGSHCSFSCDSNYVLQGNPVVTCEKHSGKLAWSSRFPVCKKAASRALSTLKNIPCLKPPSPSDGTVVCDSNGKNVYPHGSVCQFFCYPGFLIENLQTGNAMIVCKNGKWTPNNKARCLATYCSEPKTLKHGSTRCNKDVKDASIKSKYKNGTICFYQCDSGFIIPKSQKSFKKIVCNAPYWNDSHIPECKQMSIPLPHPKDCQNTTKIANRRGFVKLKPPRFYLKGLSSTKEGLVYGKCNHTNKLKVGFYLNHCTAYNSELNTTGSCTYSITVKENVCPRLPDVPHSVLTCNNQIKHSFPRRTVCNYTCDNGFVIPLRLKKFRFKTCIPKKLIWLPDGMPSCKRAESPSPKKHSCIAQELFLSLNETSVKIKLPRFKSSIKGGKVKVSCLLKGALPVGNYTNKCEAKDKELGTTSSCEYNITVQARGCPVLTSISNGSASCSATDVNGFLPLGSLCKYDCDEGNVIPTSFLQYSSKTCVSHELWNSSIVPACIPLTLPTPEFDSCLDHTIEVKDLESFEIITPKFRSAVGAALDVECKPKNVSSYGMHNISCTAFDPQLRATGSCLFQIDVRNYDEAEEFSREENSCEDLGEIENGVIECQYNKSKLYSPGTFCEVICDDDFVVPHSKRNSSFALCLNSGQWNISLIPDCVKNEAPVLVSGCKDVSINISDVSLFNVLLPIFHTSQNTSAGVICIPDMLTNYGEHDINCTALDNELNSSTSCNFVLNLIKDKLEEFVTDTPSTASEVLSSTTTLKPFLPCEKIIVPNRGFINCSEGKPVTNCTVGCIDGYGFSSEYKTLRKGSIKCDGTDGLWDYQRDRNTNKLPECLGYLPNTSVNVWLSFNASVSYCNVNLEDAYQTAIKASLIGINEKKCQVVDCVSHLEIGCSEDALNQSIINVNWTLQMAFKPPGPTEVPDYELYIENILTTTQGAIQSESEWKQNLTSSDINVNQHSFKRGKFVLDCDEDGYAVDYITEKCVECPPGFIEIQNVCVPCSPGEFQLKSGQTSCEPCSSHAFSNSDLPASCSG